MQAIFVVAIAVLGYAACNTIDVSAAGNYEFEKCSVNDKDIDLPHTENYKAQVQTAEANRLQLTLDFNGGKEEVKLTKESGTWSGSYTITKNATEIMDQILLEDMGEELFNKIKDVEYNSNTLVFTSVSEYQDYSNYEENKEVPTVTHTNKCYFKKE